jgi:SAM-dependent methyltransferase
VDTPRWQARERARELARAALARNDALGWFEQLYREAAGETSKIPWADAEGHPLLVEWLASAPPPRPEARRALVIGCGLGEDSECLRHAGWEVTAFDVAPTAIEWCRALHPEGADYVCADLFAPPPLWAEAFDLVFECYTLQALPASLRPEACARLRSFVRRGGGILVISRLRHAEEDVGQLPWPLLAEELDSLATVGFQRREWDVVMSGPSDLPARHVRARFERDST